jgi:hypothetical protein
MIVSRASLLAPTQSFSLSGGGGGTVAGGQNLVPQDNFLRSQFPVNHHLFQKFAEIIWERPIFGTGVVSRDFSSVFHCLSVAPIHPWQSESGHILVMQGAFIHGAYRPRDVSYKDTSKERFLQGANHTLLRHDTENSKQICPEKKLRGLSPNVQMCERFILYIPWIGLSILCCRKICAPILRIYKSLTDTWMWKLGLRPRNSFFGNT